MSSPSSPEAEFQTKNIFHRALMFRRFLAIAINHPKNAISKVLRFLSRHLMTISIIVGIGLALSSIYYKLLGDKYAPIPVSVFKEQYVRVEGRVQCCIKGGCTYPAYVGIELMDDNYFSQDTLMDETVTGYGGHFKLYASRRQLGGMKPYLQVHHRCATDRSTAVLQSFRVSWYRIPVKYVFNEYPPLATYELYPLSLNILGFVDIDGYFCPDTDCANDKLSEDEIHRRLEVIEKYTYFTRRSLFGGFREFPCLHNPCFPNGSLIPPSYFNQLPARGFQSSSTLLKE